MKYVVIVNPTASRFRLEPKSLEDVYRQTSGRGIVVTPTTQEELEEELRQIEVASTPMVIVAGGDGTVSRFTTAAMRVWQAGKMPPIGVIGGGTMNTIARSLGMGKEAPAEQLIALVTGTGLRQTQRWPLEVGRGRFGWLFGTGIIPRYIRDYDAGGEASPAKAARVLRNKVVSAFLGGAEARAFFAKHRCDVIVDGRLLPLKEWLLVTIGGTHDLGLGFRPFPGLLDHPATLGLYATGSTPSRFAMDLPAIRLQLPVRHPLAFQKLATEIQFVAPEPILYNLDGELETSEGGSLTVGSGPPMIFTLPPSAKPPANKLGP